MPEPLIDPDCAAGKCGSCVGGPCECDCHIHKPLGTDPGEPDEGPFCECGDHWPCQAVRELPDRRAPVDDLCGADPDYLGGQSVDDYIRETADA